MKLRVALAQINPTVGDFAGNAALIHEAVSEAANDGAHVVVFPEMIVTGYPVEDLALRPSFQAASIAAVEKIASTITSDIVAVVGYLDHGPKNAVAVIHQGQIKARYFKQHLPNYGVFDEFRNFKPGDKNLVVRIQGVDVAVAICEDIWHSVDAITARKPGLLVVPNGSPFERNKDDVRLALVQKRAQEIGAPIAYVNMTGGQDDLVFDGDTIVVDADGGVLARSAQFVDQMLIVDIECSESTSTPDLEISWTPNKSVQPLDGQVAVRLSDEEEMWQALVIGLRDYVSKNGFRSVVLGLSGGIDSALVAAIAVDAIGANNVFGVSLPSRFSSDHSLSDAALLAKNTGLVYSTEPIETYVEQFVDKLSLEGLAAENLQARIRAVILMAKSNSNGHLLLSTGNKTELAVGYSTIYGDAAGGYAPIKDVEKTLVWDLARYRNELATKQGNTPPIPEASISKPPSAELRPDQLDQDSLPDYAVLDRILELHIEQRMSESEIIAQGLDATTVESVIRLVSSSEWKRRQSAIGPRITKLAFGRERRLPITRWSK